MKSSEWIHPDGKQPTCNYCQHPEDYPLGEVMRHAHSTIVAPAAAPAEALRGILQAIVDDARVLGAQSTCVLPESYVKSHLLNEARRILLAAAPTGPATPPLDFGMGNEMNAALSEDAAKLEALTGERHAYPLSELAAPATGAATPEPREAYTVVQDAKRDMFHEWHVDGPALKLSFLTTFAHEWEAAQMAEQLNAIWRAALAAEQEKRN
jgi:hypothetical protein